jgi:hypothetical protein
MGWLPGFVTSGYNKLKAAGSGLVSGVLDKASSMAHTVADKASGIVSKAASGIADVGHAVAGKVSEAYNSDAGKALRSGLSTAAHLAASNASLIGGALGSPAGAAFGAAIQGLHHAKYGDTGGNVGKAVMKMTGALSSARAGKEVDWQKFAKHGSKLQAGWNSAKTLTPDRRRALQRTSHFNHQHNRTVQQVAAPAHTAIHAATDFGLAQATGRF